MKDFDYGFDFQHDVAFGGKGHTCLGKEYKQEIADRHRFVITAKDNVSLVAYWVGMKKESAHYEILVDGESFYSFNNRKQAMSMFKDCIA